jgi:hypothetical protein
LGWPNDNDQDPQLLLPLAHAATSSQKRHFMQAANMTVTGILVANFLMD